MTTAPAESTKPDELLVRLLDPAVRADPYPLFAQFRERGSFVLPEGNLAVFSTYRDCEDALRHPSSSNDRNKWKSCSLPLCGVAVSSRSWRVCCEIFLPSLNRLVSFFSEPK